MFVHLHVRSHYSLLESSLKISQILKKVKDWGSPAVALTDHGNMFGAVDFYLAAKAQGTKPILGCEIIYTKGDRFHKPEKKGRGANVATSFDQDRLFRLVLLVQNEVGYRNLSQIVTKSYTEGFHLGRPRADRSLIAEHFEGLIALTSGFRGELAYYALHQKFDLYEESLDWLSKTFQDKLYLEIQDAGFSEQSKLHKILADSADKRGLPLVATADAAYLEPQDQRSQEALMCVSMGKFLRVENNSRNQQFYLKSPDEMKTLFAWRPDAIENTLKIAELCHYSFKLKDDQGKPIYHLPSFTPDETTPEGAILYQKSKNSQGVFDINQYLRNASVSGLDKRLQGLRFQKRFEANHNLRGTYQDRLEEELSMIERTGFSGYFLIVADFIQYAKSQSIPVGPGRGSGAGSLVAYALGITDIDPIEFNLLFERFINPERISMPDFDVDFCQDRRGEVIDYVIRKYGTACVSQIVTFGKLLAKSVVRDVGRVLEMSYADVDVIAKLVPDELGITLGEAFEKEPLLRERCEKDPKVARLFEIARSLEGLNRNAGIHAAGVVITNRPLVEYCPLYLGKESESVIQFDKDYAEKIGLIKFDFLGLKTLTVIDNAIRMIREGVKSDFSLEDIDYSDPEVFALISAGDTDGVFQLESSGMKDLCSRVQPTNLEDITSINALYRPGPLESGMVDDFINRKHGRTVIEYPLPQLEPILKETYGVIVYQEQVMRTARELAGYSLGEADILRRAMGKKKAEEMAAQKDKFMKGCLQNQVPEEKADFIFELLAKFASYGFNKSHSAAYGVLSFQTAYLKRYYAAQFLAALMATEMDHTEKLSAYIVDARRRNLDVLPPNINESEAKFSVTQGKIRFGLEAIKGVGSVAVDVILEERRQRGPFTSFLNFCERVSSRKVNKKVLESLIQVGAFDSIAEENRKTLQESLDSLLKYGSGKQAEVEAGQVNLFDSFQQTKVTQGDLQGSKLYQQVPDWPDSEKLQMEKQLVGFYVSGHPMESLSSLMEKLSLLDLSGLKNLFEEKKKTFKPVSSDGLSYQQFQAVRDQNKFEVVTAGVISTLKEITTKKGSKMAFCDLEDARTKIEVVTFPEPYTQLGELLQKSLKNCEPFVFKGQMDLSEEQPKILLRGIEPFEQYKSRTVSGVVFKLELGAVRRADLSHLRIVLQKYRGSCPTFLEIRGLFEKVKVHTKHSLPRELYVDPRAEFLSEVRKLLGADSVVLKTSLN